MPLVLEAKMPDSPVLSLVMLIDLVMVTAPNPPGSRTLISPPAIVFVIAPANVLQGAVRLHGLCARAAQAPIQRRRTQFYAWLAPMLASRSVKPGLLNNAICHFNLG